MKIFAHRGYVTPKAGENTLQAVIDAYEANFTGVEIDLWFINNEFYIVHDQPDIGQLNDLPKLKDLLIYDNFDFWLDFKNLDITNYQNALIQLKKDLSHVKLSNIFFAPYVTNYKISEIILKAAKKSFDQDLKLVANFDENCKIDAITQLMSNIEIDYISIQYDLITKENLTMLDNDKLMAWTIKDKETFESLLKQNIKIFASDIILP